MKKNNILTVLRVFTALAVWFIIYKCYGTFIDPMLEGKLPQTVRLIFSAMMVPYTLGIGAAYLIVRGIKKQDIGQNTSVSVEVTPGFILKSFLVQMGMAMPVTMILNIIMQVMGHPVQGMTIEQVWGENKIFYLVLLLIFAPIVEELFFRKLFLDRLLVLGEKKAILMSAILFGLPHLFSQGLPQLFSTFLVGLVWADVRVKTGKLWPGILLHMLFNLYGCYFTIFMAQNNGTAMIVVLLNLIILPVSAIIIRLSGRSKRPATAQVNL